MSTAKVKKASPSKKELDAMVKDTEATLRRQTVELDALNAEVKEAEARIARTQHQLLRLGFQRDFGEEY